MSQRFAMFDTVDVTMLPKGKGNWAVAGYVGGSWPTFFEIQRLYPNHPKLSIAVNAGEDADCLDVEQGDATPAQAPGWYWRQKARKVARPCFYIQLSNARLLIDTLASHRIPRSAYRLWTAHYTHQPHICGTGCGLGADAKPDATQWTDRSQGRNLDESLCEPTFFAQSKAAPRPTPRPKPKPAPHPSVHPYPGYVLVVGKHDTGGNHNAVSAVQAKLGVKPVDGKYGPVTEGAVKRFQQQHKLQVDGMVGPQTWKALFG